MPGRFGDTFLEAMDIPVMREEVEEREPVIVAPRQDVIEEPVVQQPFLNQPRILNNYQPLTTPKSFGL